uniref:Lipocalin/cytosolic fatty-acid binding domain-containing protein n=1 Tax=Clastoptera arizonana TaxID=38151 RepID=A0A1B6D0R5_9HEMI
MQMLSATVLLTAVVAASALNPISRFGKCKDYSVAKGVSFQKDLTGVWYIQRRPQNPDNGAHTCQAIFSKYVKYPTNFIYYYNQGEPVNRPIQYQFIEESESNYRGGITVEDKAITLRWEILYVNDGVLVSYLCTREESANPGLDAIYIATRVQTPKDSDLAAAVQCAKDAYRKVNNKELVFDKVVQDLKSCEPLEVIETEDDPLQFKV